MTTYRRLFQVVALILGGLGMAAFSWAEEGIGMVTGSRTGTYFQFGNNIADSVKGAGLQILVKESEGSIDNIRRLSSTENATLGIVQSDVLGFLGRSESAETRKIASRLRLVFPFYNEEVHLFANTKVQRFGDLTGKRVVVGKQGSGNWLTATNLLQMTGVKLGEAINLPPLEAVTAVLKGEADAMIYVAGKPVELFSKLGNLKEKPEFAPFFANVHFVPLDDTLMLREYKTSEIGPADYPWIDKKVPTIAVKAVLMSFDYSSKRTPYFRQRCQELATIGQAIRNGLDNLRKNGHPKWREVNLDDKIGTWEIDTCSREDAGKTKPNVDITKELEKVLLNQHK